MRLRQATAALSISLTTLGGGGLLAQCAPAPTGHPPDCTQRDENGDGYPDNGVSASGTTGTCTFSKTFQDQIGEPIDWVEAFCRRADGSIFKAVGASGNIDLQTNEEYKRKVFCTYGFVGELTPQSTHS